jgi:hypothetical protein
MRVLLGVMRVDVGLSICRSQSGETCRTSEGIMKRSLLLTIVLGTMMINNCTFKIVAPPPRGLKYGQERLPQEAAIFIPPNVGSEEVSKNGLLCVGPAHKWNVYVGNSLINYSIEYFNTLYKKTHFYEMKSDFVSNENIDVVIEPSITYFDISQSLKTKLNLRCIILDREGQTIYESEFYGETQKSQVVEEAYYRGVLVAEPALADSLGSALDDAFKKLLLHLRTGESWERLRLGVERQR